MVWYAVWPPYAGEEEIRGAKNMNDPLVQTETSLLPSSPDSTLPVAPPPRHLFVAATPSGESGGFDLVSVVPAASLGQPLELIVHAAPLEFVDAVRSLGSHPRDPRDFLPEISDTIKFLNLASDYWLEVATTSGINPYELLADLVEKRVGDLSQAAFRQAIVAQEITPQILHLQFPNEALLAHAMLRFEEYYESPRFHSSIFSRDEFKAWYRGTQPHGGFSYYFDWPGFQVPIRCFEPFRNGDFADITVGERIVLDIVARYPETRSVIATAIQDDGQTLSHEIAHGLFHTVPQYQSAALAIIGRHDCAPLHRVLADYGYPPHTWDDEVQAYLIGDLDEIVPEDAESPRWAELRDELQRLFAQYAGTIQTSRP